MKSLPLVPRTTMRLICAATLFWVVGCKSGGAPAGATAPQAVKPALEEAQKPADKAAASTDKTADKAATKASDKKKPNFKVSVSVPALSVGAKGAASVSVAALNGYKWNKEYPAKLLFKAAPKNVKLGKSEFKQMAGDFKIADKKADIPVTMQANTAGKETVQGTLKFSICNETACIIEKADVALAVNVQ